MFDEQVVSFQISEFNRPPVMTDIEDQIIREGDELVIEIEASDPDGDDLTYSWYIDGQHISDDPVFEHKLDAGDHKVMLQVTSDGDLVTDELDVTVVEDVGGGSMGTVLAIAVLGVVGVIVLALVLRRRTE